MPSCVKCATPLPEGARHCPACGADNTGDTSKSTSGATTTPDPDLEQRVRTELAAQFAIERVIGRGGMGVVFLATETRLARRVAIKVLLPWLTFDGLAVERFLREARTAATLDHPHVIPIYRVSEDGGRLDWYAMKYLEGESLGELLDRERRLPIARVNDIVSQVAEALDYAHRNGVVHRDIKPGNVMIGPGGWVTVTDFGIAKAAGSVSLTGSGGMVGTPDYMSPEQCAGTELTPAADQYSLAILAFQMVSGRLPFRGNSTVDVIKKQCFDPPPSLLEFAPDVPPDLAAVVNRGLAKAREDRFPTVREFADAFVRAARGESIHLPAPSSARPSPRTWRRPLSWGSAVVLVGVVAFFVRGLISGPDAASVQAPERQASPPTPTAPVQAAARTDSTPAAAARPAPRRDTPRTAAPAGEVGYVTVGSRPLSVMSINGKPAPSNPITNFEVPAGTVRLHFQVSDSLGEWSYDTTIAVAPRERRNVGRVRLARP